MKNKFFVPVSIFLLLHIISCGTTGNDSHTSRNSLDWAGMYTGVIPGADSEGINVQIILNSDETYQASYQYIGKSDDVFTYTGTFKWDNKGSVITLDSKDIPPYYKVGENILIQLDMSGNIIGGEFADDYVLKKQH